MFNVHIIRPETELIQPQVSSGPAAFLNVSHIYLETNLGIA